MAEEFRKVNDRIEVSDLGNVKRDGKLISPLSGEFYDYVTDRGKQIRIHQMVAEMFPEICGKPIKWGHIHHKNRNQRDNRADNLVWLTRSEHKRIHQLEDGVSVPVKAYDKDGRLVGRWDSKQQAAKETGIDYRHITEIILGEKGRFTAGKLYWFKDEVPEEKINEKILTIENIKYQTLRK